METYNSAETHAALMDELDSLPFVGDDGVIRGTAADQFGPWRQQ
jgi:hypothetical protein